MPPGLAVQVHSRGASCAGNHHCGGTSSICEHARETEPQVWALVASMNRPGGNVTDVSALTNELSGKQLGLLGPNAHSCHSVSSDAQTGAFRYAFRVRPARRSGGGIPGTNGTLAVLTPR
jgi:hypothetical protein